MNHGHRRIPRRLMCLSAGVALVCGLIVAIPMAASAAGPAPVFAARPAAGPSDEDHSAPLPAPPIPVVKPTSPAGYRAPSTGGLRSSTAAPPTTGRSQLSTAAAAPVTPATARTFGPTGPARTLVLYDTTGSFGWLGELYAMGAGNLASHFGAVTTEPVTSYVSGQLSQYTAVIYLGSTYNEPLPTAFLTDVVTGTTPVIWAGANVWQLAGDAASNAAFQQRYGWDPSTSYYDTADQFSGVTYGTTALTRSAAAGALLVPHVTTGVGVSVLATAPCRDAAGAVRTCDGIAQVNGANAVPWAVGSANLTFLSEIPLSYITESDRYLVFADLLFPALNPSAPTARRAMVRLEDVNPGNSDPAQLRQIADYLSSQQVPFSVAVIPAYRDPLGVENGGVNTSLNISNTGNTKVKAFNSALKYMVSKGGTLIQHGTTHQFGSLRNPYDGVSANDFEFYSAHCSTTAGGPVDPAGCPDTDWVVQTGPVRGDSQQWAASRVNSGRVMFAAAGLPTPTIFETPHYSGSVADYAGMRQYYATRYERSQYFGGQLNGSAPNYSRVFGQFFPYAVQDISGSRILPESLGNYEPVPFGNNPPRLAADMVNNARAELAVRQGVASFFYHPYNGLDPLVQTVTGIKALGYTFVSPAAMLAAS